MGDVSEDMISLYRAVLAEEKGTVQKEWGGRFSVALSYPNVYRLGMSNLGFQIVYRLLNQRSDVVAERVFLPEGNELSLHLRSGRPLLSLESQSQVGKFDLVAFSLSFENDYPNILQMLQLAKIPIFATERSAYHPWIMAGGIATFLNPEPLAPFVDFFLLGEGEPVLNELMDRLTDLRDSASDRDEILQILAKSVPSFYAPSLYRQEYNQDGTIRSFEPLQPGIPGRIRVARSEPQDSVPLEIPVSAITTPRTEFGERVLIELGRGCGRSCRFCAAGYAYRPPRLHKEAKLGQAVAEALKRCSRVGLLGAAVSDVPGIENLTATIVEQGASFSVSSLRADTLTEPLLNHLKQAGQRTVTIAPEAGSERLRKVINKHLSTRQITSAARLISKVGDFSLRLYFLIGLPTETGEDIAAIVDLVKKIKHSMVKEAAPRGRMGRIKLSVSCFIPKPMTPFQWFPMEPVPALQSKQRRVKKILKREGGVDVNADVPKWAYIQALLSLGDRRVGSILATTHRMNGDWTRALRYSEVNPDFFVHRPKGLEELLPWDFIDHGISKAYLRREYRSALEGKESDICSVGDCFRCGVCVS
jgi:radical SAM superfamily enzyme YgiQ (UPF0313 family)